MKQCKSKKTQAFIVNQAEQLFPDLEFLAPLCLKNLLRWKAEQLHDLALRVSELSSALNTKFGDFPDYEESHRFYSKLNRSTKNKYLEFPLAACVDLKIINMDELNTFVRKRHIDINITNLQKCFAFAQGVVRIKIKEPHALLLLASACSAVSLLYRIINQPLQEDMLKTFIAIEHLLTTKTCETIGYWTKKLDEKKGSQIGGGKHKMTIPILKAIVEYLKEKPSRMRHTNFQIGNNFVKEIENSEISVRHNGCAWDVFFTDDKIGAVPDKKSKANNYQARSLSTIQKSYIAEAKKIIKGESEYNKLIKESN